MLELILTCDLGTTSCKTTLFTTDGKVKVQANKEYRTYYPQVGWAEQDPEEWWETVVATIRDCGKALSEPVQVLSVCLASQRETLVLLGREGNVISRAISWLDKRSAHQTTEMSNHFGREYIHKTTGMIPYPNFPAPKLLWVYDNSPELLKNTYKILQPRDYIYYKLTGKFATDYSLASRTMMMDMNNKRWCRDIMDYVGVKESMMPDVYYSHEAPGKITKEAAGILNINENIPVVLGGGDRCCEALGSGIFGSSAMESTATAGNFSFVSDRLPDKLNDKIICTFHVIENKWLMEQGLTTTGTVLRWFRDNIYYSDGDTRDRLSYADMDREIKNSPIGSNKLLLLPFFMGARSTRFNPQAKGTYFGLDLSHKRGDMARSIMEGVAFEVRACIDILSDMGMDVEDIVLMGGGSKADVWNSIKADIYNRTIRVPQITEASSFGAFILGGYAAGLFKEPEEAARRLNKTAKEYAPNRENNELYMRYYEIYNELYNSLEPLFDKLDRI